MKIESKRLRAFCFPALLALTAAMTPAYPAGLLTPTDGSLPALEIKAHHVDVVIEDGYATTRVEQVFHNPHQRDLEAIYSFPVPDKAAVAEFTVWIDGQPVNGEVVEKKRARQIYEEEKAAGRDAGLAEQDGYKTFDLHVAPVRAGQDTRIRLTYIQPAHVDTGIGRYVYPLEEGGVDEEKLAFWTANEVVREQFSFKLKLRSAYPVEGLRVPNQPQAAIGKVSDQEWTMELVSGQAPQTGVENETGAVEGPASTAQPQAFSLNRDIVVYWRHADGLPGSVDLVAYKPETDKRGTFMLVVTPGDDLAKIEEGSDWIFVLDVSGSMQGKYGALAEGVGKALGAMRPQDRFRIVLFNDGSRELTPGYVNATPENVTRYINEVAGIQANGGTNLYAGLANGLDRLDADRTSAVVLVTDGVANVGVTEQKSFIELVRKKDVRLFTFIMGNSANKPLLETLTQASNGFAMNVSNSDDIVGRIMQAKSKVTHQAFHDVQVRIDGVKTSDLKPGYIGSLYRGQQLVLFGHYANGGAADVEVSGKLSGQDTHYRTRFTFPETGKDNPEIERLWAYAAIEELDRQMNIFGEDPDMHQAVTDLAVEYGLVTDYTSMIVLREEVFQQHGIERRNRDRLALEQQAQQQRAQQPVQSRRVDASQPMFQTNQPSFHGGGALGLEWLLAGGLLLLRKRKTRF